MSNGKLQRNNKSLPLLSERRNTPRCLTLSGIAVFAMRRTAQAL